MLETKTKPGEQFPSPASQTLYSGRKGLRRQKVDWETGGGVPWETLRSLILRGGPSPFVKYRGQPGIEKPVGRR